MVFRKKFFLLVLLVFIVAFPLSGCYRAPVRHLSADVALLKIGSSTEDEVLIYLGEPDQKEVISSEAEKWLYRDKKLSLLEKAPLVGKRFGSPEYLQVVVTLSNKIVTDIRYSSSDADELDWKDDFSWQKKKD